MAVKPKSYARRSQVATNPLPRPDSRLTRFMATLSWFVIACLVVLAAIFLLQDRHLYMPAKAGAERMAPGGLRAWPSAQDFRGLVAEPPGLVRGTAIAFHGNAGHAGHRVFYAAALTQLGWRVILAKYPGHGPRGGMIVEESLVNDAERPSCWPIASTARRCG